MTLEPRIVEATLAGGRYCHEIANEAEPPPNADATGSTGQAQPVPVRMTLSP